MSAPCQLDGRLWARWGLDPVAGLLDGVVLEWSAGRFFRVEAAPRPPRDYAPGECFPYHFVTPGLLNAHAHLDYSFLRGALPGGQGFVPWLRAMIAARRAFTPEQEPAARAACTQAIGEMIRDGVTEVWDVSSYGWARSAWPAGLCGISFEEFIAPRQARWLEQWARWRDEFARVDWTGPAPGVSAHTAYTVCPPALKAVTDWAEQLGLPLAIHLAESPEENEMLIQGQGALLELFNGAGGADLRDDMGVGRTPIARAAAAGALGPRTLAIHCNLPQPGEAAQLAASGTPIAFCPRSHDFFGYPPYPLTEYRDMGVRLALGTDSLSSNDHLSIRAEMQRLAELAPDWPPLAILACATGAGLGTAHPFGGRGRLQAGLSAQWAVWPLPAAQAAVTVDSLLQILCDRATDLAASSALF